VQVDLIKDNGHHYFIKYLDSIDGQVRSGGACTQWKPSLLALP
jgi:hypothetical protein